MAKVFADDISLCTATEPLIVYRRFAIFDSTGNQNWKLDRNETASCVVTLRCNSGSVTGLTGSLRSLDPNLEVLQGSASFGNANAGDTVVNGTSRFRLHAFVGAPIEYPMWCEMALSGSGGFADTIRVPVVAGDSVLEPLGPDAYGYMAYDNGDIWYSEHPVYDWAEIRDAGTQLSLGDDATSVLDLPIEFGPLYYYGRPYTKLSVCSNGWVAPDTSTRLDFNNIRLPDSLAPQRIIAVLWDNFDPTAYGWIGWYHDTANHRLIVEWDSVPYFPQHVQWEKFQIIFYDSTVPGPSRDNVFVMQYATARNIGSVGCGIQNHERTSGLTYLQNASYPRQAAAVLAGRAVKYQSLPLSGVREMTNAERRMTSVAVRSWPNPVRGRAEFSVDLPGAGLVKAGVYDATGRLVTTIADREMTAGRHELTWDASRVREGVYFCRVSTAQGRTAVKLVVAR
jgi:hypothetical protein